MTDTHTVCSKCGAKILTTTFKQTDGVCIPCSRYKGPFERDKDDGHWRPEDPIYEDFPFAIAGTKTGWDVEANSLSDYIISHEPKYTQWGSNYLQPYIKSSGVKVKGNLEVWEIIFFEGGRAFDIIYELPGDENAFWIVSFETIAHSHNNKLYPKAYSRIMR